VPQDLGFLPSSMNFFNHCYRLMIAS